MAATRHPHDIELDLPRTDSAFSSPRKRTKRAAAAIASPLLSSLDTSPSNLEAFRLSQPRATLPPHSPSRSHSQTYSQRLFVQGPLDADIFGIRLPSTSARRGENAQTFDAGSGGAGFDSSELGGDKEMENGEWGVMRSPEKKTPSWLRCGSPKPLGEMRMAEPGEGRESLDFSSAMDLDGDPFGSSGLMAQGNGRRSSGGRSSAGSGEGSRQISREWPPSPKKSPVKRKLQFRQPHFGAVETRDFADVETRRMSETEVEAEDDDGSFLASLRDRRPGKQPLFAAREEVTTENDDIAALDRDFVRPQPRPRKSLLRRRRPTNVHEDPLSPRPDITTRVGKTSPNQRMGSSGSEGSTHRLEAIEDAVGARMLGQGKGLLEVQDMPNRAEAARRGKAEEKLWSACGGDVGRWNRGDFGGGDGLGFASLRW